MPTSSEKVTLKSTPTEIYNKAIGSMTEIAIWALITGLLFMMFVVVAFVTFTDVNGVQPPYFICLLLIGFVALACMLQAIKAFTVFGSALALLITRALIG